MWDNILFILTVIGVGYVFVGIILPKFGLRS